METEVSADALREAEVALRAREWHAAAAALERVSPRDMPTQLKLHLARNLAAMRTHRPAMYDALVSAPSRSEYQVAATPLGKLSVMHRPTGVLMCASHDPPAAARQQVDRIASALDQGQAVGLFGLGDGYVLDALAARPCQAGQGMTNALLVFEPAVDAVMACLMLHDWSGEGSPIRDDRVHWFVGSAWRDDYRRAALDDLYLPTPQVCLATGHAGKAVHAEVQRVVNDLKAYDATLRQQVEEHYAHVTRDQLVAAMDGGDGGAERPRVLITTSRFTTVLRYAAADTADAFARLGWDVRLSMEQHDWQRTSIIALRRCVAEHRPHLVLAIDHLRREFGDLYPLQLPFACWIQDDLAQLTTAEAGRSVGMRDFVLTVSASMYTTHYAYPQRQCATMTKLTAPPRKSPEMSREKPSGNAPFPGARLHHAPDIVFVSHAGKPANTLLDEVVGAFDQVPEAQPFIEACGRRVIERYAAGGCVRTLGEMDRLVRDVERETGKSLLRADLRDGIVRRLLHPLNNALYRQQALQWTLAGADRLGACVELYGQGWDAHPDFGRFARGPVAYGRDLADLTRRAAISLHIVPFFYLHQRLLDGLVAGGFFLIREHPSDTWRLRWKAFVEANIPADAATVAEARPRLDAGQLHQLDLLLAESHDTVMIHGYDNLASYRDLHAQGLGFLYEDLPRRAEVSFGDADTLASRLERFLADPSARRDITEDQRLWVERHYTYDAGLARATRRIASLLRDEP